jgi:energy-coupling factor transporter ATP-binding protein EcfA2
VRKPVIEFVDFGFQYRSQSEPTLHDINLTIYEGEKVLIVGPSGSGKSSLAHCINGLVPFFYPGEMTGSLRIMGMEQNSLNIQKLSEIVGTVLQDPDGQFVGLTVAEDIAFKLENDNVPQAEMIAKVAEAARIVGIHSHLDIAPYALSGGQKQRTTIAGVLVDQVGILLFDEPLANLDPLTGKSAIELIHQIHEQSNRTIIIIEHRLEDVLHREIDRIIVVNEGRITADMTPDELLSSNVLVEAGIREPLYITALRYAGCHITPDMKPQHVDTLVLDHLIEPLKVWYKDNEPQGHDDVNEPVLELRHVDFSYEEGKPILEDVSLIVNKGEMLSIVGKNGAGKSTISKLVCGFYKPTAGSILLDGDDMKKLTIKERSEFIGFVLQNPNQMISKPMLFDEVALGLRIREISEEETIERVHEVLKVCGLYEFRKWPISALSFGQKKRVTIASILVLNPQIIILDEPTAGQDYKHYNEIMEFLIDLNHRGVTIVMITHDMHLMLEYTQRAYVLSDGKVIAGCTPADVLTDSLIVEAANLKATSVFELAVRAGFIDPREFVRRFIDYDRRLRNR